MKWAQPLNSKRFHVFHDAVSLCGKWMFKPHLDCTETTGNETKGREDCAECFRRLQKHMKPSSVGKIVSAILILLFASTAFADAPPKTSQPIVPAKLTAKAGKPLVLDLSKYPNEVEWFTDDVPDADSVVIDCKKLTFASPFNGDYPVRVAVLVNGKIMLTKCVITIKDGVARPDVPPPNPTDDPLPQILKTLQSLDARLKALEGAKPPPAPPKPVDPAPIPLAGFRVLIIYDMATLTADQQGVVFGKKVRDYMQAKCVVGQDGKTKDFWILQKGLDVSAAPKWVGDVIQRHPNMPVFMVVSDGKTGYEGPLPVNADEAMTILQKIGGQ